MDLGGLEDLDINSIDLDQELGDPDNPETKESRMVSQPEKTPLVHPKNPHHHLLHRWGGPRLHPLLPRSLQ